MEILIKNLPEEEIRTDVLVLPFYEDYPSDVYSHLDSLINGQIRRVTTAKEFTGAHNKLTLLHVQNINAGKVLLAGLGRQSEVSAERIRQAGGKALSFLRELGSPEVAVSNRLFRETFREFQNLHAGNKQIYYFLEGGLLGLYRYDRYKKPENGKEKEIKSLTVLDDAKDIPLKRLQMTNSAVQLARDLVNTPSNTMTPIALSEAARSLSGRKVKIRILEWKNAEKEGMGAYLAVSKGSSEPPKFIILEYSGGRGEPYALIGKSVTFDSGGISLKPSEGMEKMKYDMAGGAAVLGAIKAISEMNLPVNIVGILPATENLPGGNSFKPGDVITSITGRTIEIISTDAEGRLTLADAIGYAIKYYKPKAIIDIATLTGACSIALGHEAIAMMGTDADLMERLRRAAEETYERVWQMPLYEEYKEYIKSDIADVKNSGGRSGSLVSAGYFLREFAGDTPWVHLDIAGSAWNDKDTPYAPKGASGIGVRLLVRLFEGMSLSK